MKRNAFIAAVLFVLLVGACAPQAAPTVNPVDVQHTAEASAFTMVAQTEQALPTNTPTEIPSSTPAPTETLLPSPTIDPLIATATNTIAPTSIPQQPATDASLENCNKPLTAWEGPTADLALVNETKPEGKITLSLYVQTELGECGYLANLSSGPEGMYSAGAFVDGKQSFKVFGYFRITEGSWKIIVRNDKITATGKCYPHC